MLLHIEADPPVALHAHLRLAESAYRQASTPYGLCHVFGLPQGQAALLFEHFPLDLQPTDGHFPAPGPIARKYNNARIYASSALAAAAFRLAVADLLHDPGTAAAYRLSLTNAYLPSAALLQAVQHSPYQVAAIPQPTQPDMGELIISGQGTLQDILLLALSLLALSDPEAMQWLDPSSFQQLRADAGAWLGDAAADLDAQLQRRAQGHYSPAYKLLADDGDPQAEQDARRAPLLAASQASGWNTALTAELLRLASEHPRIAILDFDDASLIGQVLAFPALEVLALYHPAIHVLQALAAQLNQSGLTPEQAANIRLSPQAAWIQDEALQHDGLMVWLHALDGLHPDLLHLGLHNLLTRARPAQLLLPGHGQDFWRRSDVPPPAHAPLVLADLVALAQRLQSEYAHYSCAVETLPTNEPGLELHLLRLTLLPQS
jgi:hypothetical protein